MRFMDSMREDMRVAGVTEVTDLTSQKRNDSTKQFFFSLYSHLFHFA